MGNIKYMIGRLCSMDYGAMLQKAGAIHKKTGRSRIWILKDMVHCARRYGAGYVDYDLYEMYDLTPAQRDTFLTRGRNNALIRKYNDPAQSHIFDNKDEFNRIFNAYLRRDWLSFRENGYEERLTAFLDNNPVFIAKPIDGTCGNGVEKIDQSRFPDRQALLTHLRALGTNYIVEGLIRQHPALMQLYPDAVNTCRLVTIRKDGVTHIIYAVLRIGSGGSHVDNFSAGGMVAPLDEKTGTVSQAALDKEKNLYATHPMTGTPIQGFALPDWQAALDMAKEASTLVEGVNYIGWDIAFSEEGPVFVEGNPFPGHNLNQMHTPDHVGIMDKFRI